MLYEVDGHKYFDYSKTARRYRDLVWAGVKAYCPVYGAYISHKGEVSDTSHGLINAAAAFRREAVKMPKTLIPGFRDMLIYGALCKLAEVSRRRTHEAGKRRGLRHPSRRL